MEVGQHHVDRPKASAGILLLTFYTHIVPFGVLLLAVVALAFDRNIRAMLGRLIPALPSVVAGLIWFLTSPAGLTIARITKPAPGSLPPRYVPLPEAFRAFADWLTPGFPGDADSTRLAVWSLLCAALWALAASRLPAGPNQRDFQSGRSASTRLAFLLPLCIACYLWLPVSYDFIWPISLRFPIIAAYLLPIWLGACSRLGAARRGGRHHGPGRFGTDGCRPSLSTIRTCRIARPGRDDR